MTICTSLLTILPFGAATQVVNPMVAYLHRLAHKLTLLPYAHELHITSYFEPLQRTTLLFSLFGHNQEL